MKNYYFTFGQHHRLIDGYPMKDHWVRIKAHDAMRARLLFVTDFSSQNMESSDKWAFQYEEEKFDKSYYPKGEYQFIADIRQDNPFWWGYVHQNGTIQVKPFYDEASIKDAEQSPFVFKVVHPFVAETREEALQYIKKQLNTLYGNQQSRFDSESIN